MAGITSWDHSHQRTDVKRSSWIVRETSKTCATGATREDETSDPSRFSRKSLESRVNNEIRFTVLFSGYSSVRLRVFNFPRFVLLSNRRCFEPFVGFVALRFLRGMATL